MTRGARSVMVDPEERQEPFSPAASAGDAEADDPNVSYSV